MNQQHEELQSQSAVEHAEALVNHMAHTIGFFTAHTYLRIQNITHNVREKANQLDQAKREQTGPSGQPTEPSEQATTQAEKLIQPATKKAEEMLDYLAQRLSSLTASTKLNFQRRAARAREDVEDVWAEAQSIRYRQKEPLPQ